MRKLITILLLLPLIVSAQLRTLTQKEFTANLQHNGFYEFLPDGYPEAGVKYPVIIFLHGAGEKGNGIPGGTELPRVLNYGLPRLLAAGATMKFTNPTTGAQEKFIVLAPQLPSSQGGWTANWSEPIVQYAKDNLQIDTNRIHMTGLSLGGGGVLLYALTSQARANTLASIVLAASICDGPSSGVCNISNANTSLWSLVAQDDYTVGGGVNCTNSLVNAINACPGNTAPAIKTIYPSGGHAIWDRVYDTTHTWHNPNPYEWMLSKSRAALPPAPAEDSLPIANAGSDQTIPTGQATVLHGETSTDLGGTITSYKWEKFSGPSSYEILTPNASATWIRNMTAGIYIYRLTITDNRGLTDIDDVQITVTGTNQVPTAIPGNPQTITLPTSTVTMNGSGTDPDGTIASYLWTQVSGTAATITTPSSPTTTITGLSTTGARTFRLTITDDKGATASGDVIITVQSVVTTMDKIPMRAERFYTIVNNTYPADSLFNGSTAVKYTPGAGLVYANTGGFEARYQFPVEMNVTLKKLRWFDDKYSYESKPIRIYVITDTATMDTTYIGSFTGKTYENWDSLVLPSPITGVKYLVFRGGQWDNWMNELEAYGTYTPYTDVVPSLGSKRFRDMIGMNIYEWNFLQNKIYTFVGWEIYEPAWDILKNITHYRHYVDWAQIEGEEGHYSYSPTRKGAWYYDKMYERAASAGHWITPCIKAIPQWLMDYLPKGVSINRANEANPVKYPDPLDSVMSYLSIGKTYFQFAARYGSTVVDTNLLSVYSPPGYTANVKKTGLGYVKWMEAENEKDRWWVGGNDGKNYGYMNGRQYAAFLSAIYDGHMGAMGPNVGLKQADPTMKLTIGGTANPLPDYMRGVLDWCHEFRNDSLPFDWNCYHEYASGGVASQQFNGSSAGLPPEMSKLPLGTYRQKFATQVMMNKDRSYKRGLINSEFGYDTDPSSPLFAQPTNTKSTFLVQADWMLRTFLMYWEEGLDRTFYFQFYDNAENSPGVFGTSGVAYSDFRKRPSYDWIEQSLKILGTVDSFDARLSTFPRVMRARSGTQKKYIGWMPTMNDSTAVYTYTLANPSYRVKLYTLTAGQADAVVSFLPAGATVNITLGETPVFWEEVPAIYSLIAPSVNAGADQTITLPLANAQTPITLQGFGSDNVDTVAYQWSKVSGPGYPFIETPYRNKTNVYYITNGTYVFQLKGTDRDGKVATDELTVIVNNAPGNAAPIARAGNDTTIIAPTTYYFLNGSGSTDDVGITGYRWRKIQGPAWGGIQSAFAAQSYVYNMDPGNVYKFELTVTDVKGASSVDTVTVTTLKSGVVVPPVNKSPVANAGPDQIITLPTNSVQLNGTASSDPDGSIVSYLWEKIDGPETYTISNPNSPTPILTNLGEGQYQFHLTVVDNTGAENSEVVYVVVNPDPSDLIDRIPTKRKKIIIAQ